MGSGKGQTKRVNSVATRHALAVQMTDELVDDMIAKGSHGFTHTYIHGAINRAGISVSESEVKQILNDLVNQNKIQTHYELMNYEGRTMEKYDTLDEVPIGTEKYDSMSDEDIYVQLGTSVEMRYKEAVRKPPIPPLDANINF